MNKVFDQIKYSVDVCVVGGGMAGLIAAVAAARRGSSVVLLHDRPVLGGNASSEVRMWICGAHGPSMKETGILEEMQLLNRLRNPTGLYSAWDAVLFEFATMTPGLTTLLNCTCNDGSVENGLLKSVNAWQLTTQMWHTVEARFFIDCSGDSILAPISGAETRWGRESCDEFNESIAPFHKDGKTMGNTILMQLEETGRPQSFRPPAWAYHFDESSNLPSRVGNGFGQNFWWIELGGLQNTIADAEGIRNDLMRTAWGVWDYMKNRGPQAGRLENWRLRWMGALPGKRENRRYVGDHILTQNDLEAAGLFEDIVAYGGWSMDDHHPAGLLYPGKATLFHRAPSPYGIPLRCLYSRNVPNLFCAGRNISATHAALSSTRVMATCSLLGQAVGTAAALCVEQSTVPARLGSAQVAQLQQRLMEDDCWLPGLLRDICPLTSDAEITTASGMSAEVLRDGHERHINKVDHAWEAAPGDSVELSWSAPRYVDCLRMVFDSNLNDSKKMPCLYGCDDQAETMPGVLIKSFKIEIQGANGIWETFFHADENRRRLQVLDVRREICALRFTGHQSWGEAPIRVFALEAMNNRLPVSTEPQPGLSWTEVVSAVPAGDLAPPDNGLEESSAGSGRVGA